MSRHKVPTHLNQPDGIGKFSFRQIILVGAVVLYVLPHVWEWMPKDGPALGDAFRAAYPGLGFVFAPGSLPVVPIVAVLVIFVPTCIAALPLDPPLEHGLLMCVRWLLRERGYRAPADVAVDVGELVVRGDRVESNYGFHAVWEMPTTNLRLADAADVERAEEQWGEFLTGLTAPVQALVRSTPVDLEPTVQQIQSYRGGDEPTANARRLSVALRRLLQDHHLIERHHYLIAMAQDEESFADTVDEITDGINGLGLATNRVRRLAGDELERAVQRTWSAKLSDNPRLGPVDRAFNAAGAWYADDQWHVVLALGKWPRVLPDNALAPLVDGPYEVDTALHVSPVEADEILGGLERKSEALKVTDQFGRFRKRMLAIEDLDEFIIRLEGGEESAFDVAVYLHVHGPSKKAVERAGRLIAKRVRRSGARANSLPWEQASAIVSVAPLALNQLDRRTKRVDTSSARNLYVWTASTMWMDGAVPLGETLDSKRPVGLNAFLQPTIPNPHLAIYALTGGGKGFLIKVLSSRELFAGLVQEVFAFDQATEDPVNGEYGRWAAYCGLEYRHLATPDDFEPALADLDNYRWLGPGIVWNIAALPLQHRPEFVARFKDKLWKRAAAQPANRSWLIDELWSIVKQSESLGTDPYWMARSLAAIEDLVRTGRHMHVSGRLMTQRAKDSLEVPVMQVIQDQCGVQCYGMQNTSHISDIADRLHWTPADVRQIKRFTAGEWIVSAGPWHVAMRVTHADNEEYAMANTDNPVPAQVAA